MTTILHKLDASDRTQAVLNARRAKYGIIAASFWLQPEYAIMNRHNGCQPVTNWGLIWYLAG
jgi:hypothetical protein